MNSHLEYFSAESWKPLLSKKTCHTGLQPLIYYLAMPLSQSIWALPLNLVSSMTPLQIHYRSALFLQHTFIVTTTAYAQHNINNALMMWRRGVVVINAAQLLSTKPELKVLRRFKSCTQSVRDSRWWGSLVMVPAGNKAKRLPSVNHITKTIHHHHNNPFTETDRAK